MIQVRKDEVKHLQKNGLGQYVIAKTCTKKRFAVETSKVLVALKKYNAAGIMEA